MDDPDTEVEAAWAGAQYDAESPRGSGAEGPATPKAAYKLFGFPGAPTRGAVAAVAGLVEQLGGLSVGLAAWELYLVRLAGVTPGRRVR